MEFPQPVTAAWIAELIGAELIGEADLTASGINELHKVKTGDLVFVDHPKYYASCLESAATHIIINDKSVTRPEGKVLLFTEKPFDAYLKIVEHFRPFTAASTMIHPSASIGKDTIISPGVFIGKDVVIGDHCIIYPNTTINDYTQIGHHVIIQSGSIIGSDAFYYNTRKTETDWYRKMQSCGQVIIEDYVEIGANCTIDRGVTETTRIGRGTKMDNLVHIGHDTEIGRNCLFAAQVGIAGATKIEDGVTLWGQVGVSKTLTIGENATVLAQSGVPSSLKGGKTYFGYPAEEAGYKRRELVWVKRIPELWKKVFQDEK